MKKLVLLMFISVTAASAFGQKTPTFAKYPATVRKATAKQVNLSSHKQARMFRTNLRNSLAEGVNFAGQYVVSMWGCGTGCMEAAIIDGRNGNVFFPKQLQGIDGSNAEGEPAEFRKNSRLLVVNGVVNEKSAKNGTWYYLWTGTSLSLLKFVRVK